MPRTLGGPLQDAHRRRLLDAGVAEEALASLDLREVTESLPAWWSDLGNALYVDRWDLPGHLVEQLTTYPYKNGLVVIGTDLDTMTSLLIGGAGATVFVGPDSVLTAGSIYCGAGSSVVLDGGLIATREPRLDARNGGSIVARRDQLWASGVYLATDDMHRLEDVATGARLNPYGGHIRLGSHVWLGYDAVITGDVEIGDGAVVGLRSLVRGQKVAASSVVAGTPARVIREGVTWSAEDRP